MLQFFPYRGGRRLCSLWDCELVMDGNYLSHKCEHISFREVKLSFCRFCSYDWFGKIVANALFWAFFMETCEQYSNRGLMQVQKKFAMSEDGTPDGWNPRKYIRLLAFLIDFAIWMFHWRSDHIFRRKIFWCFTTLRGFLFIVMGSQTCLECLQLRQ